jgi:hypothetical protein
MANKQILSFIVVLVALAAPKLVEAQDLRWETNAAYSTASIEGFSLHGASFDTSARVKVQDWVHVGGRTGMHIMGSKRFWTLKLGDLRVGEGLGVIPLHALVEIIPPLKSKIRPILGLSAGISGAGFINQATDYRLAASPYAGVELGPVTIFARYDRLFGTVLGAKVDYLSAGLGYRWGGPVKAVAVSVL